MSVIDYNLSGFEVHEREVQEMARVVEHARAVLRKVHGPDGAVKVYALTELEHVADAIAALARAHRARIELEAAEQMAAHRASAPSKPRSY
jgi:hypothetical protein